MTALIDAHILVNGVDDQSRLSAAALAIVKDPTNRLWLSVASAWEITIKVGKRRLAISVSLQELFTTVLVKLSIDLMPITRAHLVSLSALPDHHRDPFDRLLIAQCVAEGLPVVSIDAAFDRYGITRIW